MITLFVPIYVKHSVQYTKAYPLRQFKTDYVGLSMGLRTYEKELLGIYLTESNFLHKLPNYSSSFLSKQKRLAALENYQKRVKKVILALEKLTGFWNCTDSKVGVRQVSEQLVNLDRSKEVLLKFNKISNLTVLKFKVSV